MENRFTKSLEPQKSTNKQIDFSSLTKSRYEGNTNKYNQIHNSQIGSNLSNLSLANTDFCKSLTENKIKTWSNLPTGNLHNVGKQNSEGQIPKWIGGMEKREMSGGMENIFNLGLNARTNINNGDGQTRLLIEYNGLRSYFLLSNIIKKQVCVCVFGKISILNGSAESSPFLR